MSILDIFRKTGTSITLILLYGDLSFPVALNTNILNSSIDYILYYPQKDLNLVSLKRLES